MPLRRRIAGPATLAITVLVISCSSAYRSMSVEEKRAYLEELEHQTLDELVEQRPEAREDLDAAVGYAIFSKTATKVPIVGTGEGLGVVVNKATGSRTYLKVTRFDVGGGLGTKKYRVVILYFEEAALEKLSSGKLEFGAGVEASSGGSEADSGGGASAGTRKQDRVVYRLTGSGVSATWTVSLIRYSVLDLGD
jgi:lipid-binding SYLF domain-containing protein